MLIIDTNIVGLILDGRRHFTQDLILNADHGLIYGLLKTGQITQYNSEEDDGYWEKGQDKAYDVLTTGQYAGTINITLHGKTHVLSNNCVRDKKTGLMWVRYVPDNNIGPGNNGKLLWVDGVNDEDIFDFKDQANVKSLGGYTDWRVPNTEELQSLLLQKGVPPYIDTTTFPSTPNEACWSSTTYPPDTLQAMHVGFGNINTRKDNKVTDTHYCRLVRLGD